MSNMKITGSNLNLIYKLKRNISTLKMKYQKFVKEACILEGQNASNGQSSALFNLHANGRE